MAHSHCVRFCNRSALARDVAAARGLHSVSKEEAVEDNGPPVWASAILLVDDDFPKHIKDEKWTDGCAIGGTTVTLRGVISIRLRHNIRVDVGLNGAVRAVNMTTKVAVAFSGRDGKAALIHPKGRALKQGRDRIDIVSNHVIGENTYYAKMFPQALQREELKQGDDAWFCHVVSPSEFYLTTDLELLLKVDETVNEYCAHTYFIVVAKYPTKDAAYNIVGDYCFAFFCNQKRWLRVEVLDWKWDEDENEDPEEVAVQSVDFGHKLKLSFRYLRPINSTFAEFPQITHKCCLAQLRPVHCRPNTNHSYDWPVETIQAFMNMCKADRYAPPFRVIYSFKENDMYYVDILDQSKEDNDTLSVELINRGLASEPITLAEYEVKQEACEIGEIVENLDLDVPDTLNEAVAGYDARDEARICPHTRPDGTCYKGASCRLEHALLAVDGWTTDKIGVHCKPVTEVCLPAIGDTITICVTHVKTCCHFYAHIVKKPAKLEINGNAFLFDESFVNFTASLQKLDVRKMDKPAVMPGIGEVVLVWLPAVKNFFRATVCNVVLAPDMYEVFFVDFGLVQMVDGAYIRNIQSNFLKLPFQAVEMRLSGYKQRNNVEEEQVKQFSLKNMKFVLFKATIISFDGSCLLIQMWDSKNPDMEFGHILINFKLAVQDTSPVLDCEVPLY